MDKFIAQQNVEHFKLLIEQETDPVQRERLEQMLADEETKLRKVDASGPQRGGHASGDEADR